MGMNALAHIPTPQQRQNAKSVTVLAPAQRRTRASSAARGTYTTINTAYTSKEDQSKSVTSVNQKTAEFKAPHDFVATCYGRVENHAAKANARSINVIA